MNNQSLPSVHEWYGQHQSPVDQKTRLEVMPQTKTEETSVLMDHFKRTIEDRHNLSKQLQSCEAALSKETARREECERALYKQASLRGEADKRTCFAMEKVRHWNGAFVSTRSHAENLWHENSKLAKRVHELEAEKSRLADRLQDLEIENEDLSVRLAASETFNLGAEDTSAGVNGDAASDTPRILPSAGVKEVSPFRLDQDSDNEVVGTGGRVYKSGKRRSQRATQKQRKKTR